MKYVKLVLRAPFLIPMTIGEGGFALFAWACKADRMAAYFLNDIMEAWTP